MFDAADPCSNGALYAFVEVKPEVLPHFDDQLFALDLLEKKHVLVAPGVSFNVAPFGPCTRTKGTPAKFCPRS